MSQANIALASIDDTAGPSGHPNLHRIKVDTLNGTMSDSTAASIVSGKIRAYETVPAPGKSDGRARKWIWIISEAA